jgi:hypothetical protein
MQGDDLEDVFVMDKDDDFDEEDRSRLDMLEQYRNSLIDGVKKRDTVPNDHTLRL